jgi:N-acyl-D-amino-acid deacylase
MLDVLIRGGFVLDGSGERGKIADIAVMADRIVSVDSLPDAKATHTIDATGLVVAPGFIDIHTHSDFALLVDGRADSQLCQGVTTEIIGQCGFSCAPIGASGLPAHIGGSPQENVDINWRSFGQYLDRLGAGRPGVNVGAFVGHGAIHAAVKSDHTELTSAQELRAMQTMLEEAIDQGAMGFSSGLEYWPGNVAPFEELTGLITTAARRGVLYSTHVRNRDVYYDLGFAEAISTARHADARLQISHIQPKFGAPANAMENSLEMVDRAKRGGLDIGFDVIPHDWNHTAVSAALPAWARAGGALATLARLRDPTQRALMKDNPKPIWRVISQRRWDIVRLLRCVRSPHLVGMTFEAIGQLRKQDPYDALLDLLLEEGENFAGMLMTSQGFKDEDICMCLRHPDCTVMSDTLALSRTGPLKDLIGSLSGYDWTARLLGHYSRDRGILTLEEAVNRITLRPAQRLGLKDRGSLQPGSFADIVVFDPAVVAAAATFLEPRVHPQGFEHVLVNGLPAVSRGQRTDQRSGRVLRRA